MAYDEALRSITIPADASIGVYTGPAGMPGGPATNGGKQFCFVKITGLQAVGLATGAAHEIVIGVLQNKPQSVGAAATVAQTAAGGVSVVLAGATFAGGEAVKSGATGKAVVADPATDSVIGIAMTAGADGELISVLLTPSYSK